ncbi:M23 family metallopeptidase [Chryseobacterium sp. ZHDP1]|nr:M23 family metallopeptidase [Chryseobacterium gleum]QWA40793.1 M23 family metallopeptidase [Chryseobacterium sp. ZHDP1]
MHLLIFSNFLPQFNTASYKGKLNTIRLNSSLQNQFTTSFLSYHIAGKLNKKYFEKSKDSLNNAANETEQTTTPQANSIKKDDDIQATSEDDSLSENHPSEKKYRNKKLSLLEYEKYPTEELQIIYMPLEKMKITSNFGHRFHPIDKIEKFHAGVDLRANSDYVFAVLDGIISDTGYSNGAGNYIKVQHGDFETIYLHLQKTFFSLGDFVYAGDIIAISGNSGKSTAPHLHFSVKERGKYIDPVHFLNDLIKTNNAISDYNYGKY